MSHSAEEEPEGLECFRKEMQICIEYVLDPKNWPRSGGATEHTALSNTKAARSDFHRTPARAHHMAVQKISDSPEQQRLRQDFGENGIELWVEPTSAPQQAELVVLRHEAGRLSWTTANQQEHKLDIPKCTILQEQRRFEVPSESQHSGPTPGTPAIILYELLSHYQDAEYEERSVRLHPSNRRDFNKL